MIVRIGLGKAEPDRDHIEEGRVRQFVALVTEIITGMEAQFVAADDKGVAVYVALVAAHSFAELERPDDAFAWLRRAVLTGGRFRGPVAIYSAELAHAQHRLDAARFFFTAACEEGVPGACVALRREKRGRPRQRPESGERGGG